MGLDREGIYRTINNLELVVSGKTIYSIASDGNSINAASRYCVHRLDTEFLNDLIVLISHRMMVSRLY
jgi:hypothetical protein